MLGLPVRGLRFKLGLGVIGTLCVVLGGVYYGLIATMLGQFWQRETDAAVGVNALVLASLEKVMLTNRWDQAEEVLQAVGSREEVAIEDIAIYRHDGSMIAFASGFPGGRLIPRASLEQDLTEPACVVCHRLPAGQWPTVVRVELEGEEVIRSALVLRNEPDCQRCHGTDRATLGFSLVDTPLDRYSESSRRVLVWLVGGGLLSVVLVALVLYLLLDRLVLAPVSELAAVTAAVAAGHWERQARIRSRDELGRLGTAVNEMSAGLRAALERETGQRRRLQETVEGYVGTMSEVGRGDLAARVAVDQAPDQAGALVALGNQLNETIGRLQRMAQQMQEGVDSLGSASAEILAMTTQQASGASEQATAISQIAATIEQMRAIADQTAGHARRVASLAAQSTEISHRGEESMHRTVAGMASVMQRVEAISSNIQDLAERTRAIGDIIRIVNEIAAQSNLLALNAAVEAARAGPSGRGFAVVADEVRSLAEQSRAATTQVQGMLEQIQRGVQSTTAASQEGILGVEQGIELTGELGGVISQLAGSIAEAAQAAAQIAAATGQQVSGIAQVAAAMGSIDQAADQNLAGAHQSRQTAELLHNLAGEMNSLVSQYKL